MSIRALRDVLAANGMSVSDFGAAFEACIDEDVTERRPQPGQHYRAFVVHPRQPGPSTLAIAHREGEIRIIDLLRNGLTIEQTTELVKAYGIDSVTGAENDEDTTMLHAIAGVLNELQDEPVR